MLAGELVDQGKEDEGIAMAKGMLKNSPDDQKVWIALGQIYTRIRKWKEAEDALNKAIRHYHEKGRQHLSSVPEGWSG